tara:strand:+ start:5400 stop:6695 length:1296 start_codon:yes stop_codon:yes gene_type:complete
MSKDDPNDKSLEYDTYNSTFDATGYDPRRPQYVDGSDWVANFQRMFVSFHHVPSGKSIFFKAFITAYNEQFTSNWSSEEVYGRNDPIQLFKNTTRKITLALKVPAASEGEAFENLGKTQSLTQFLYPNYADASMASTMAQSPLVKIKVMNLMQGVPMGHDFDAEEEADISRVIQNKRAADEAALRADKNAEVGDWSTAGVAALRAKTMKDQGAGANRKKSTYFMKYSSDASSNAGLLGVIESLTVNHNLESEGSFNVAPNTILPKLIDITISFTALHEAPLGWTTGENGFTVFESPTFPYGVQLADPVGDAQKQADADAAAGKTTDRGSLNDQLATMGIDPLPSLDIEVPPPDQLLQNSLGSAYSEINMFGMKGGGANANWVYGYAPPGASAFKQSATGAPIDEPDLADAAFDTALAGTATSFHHQDSADD